MASNARNRSQNHLRMAKADGSRAHFHTAATVAVSIRRQSRTLVAFPGEPGNSLVRLAVSQAAFKDARGDCSTKVCVEKNACSPPLNEVACTRALAPIFIK